MLKKLGIVLVAFIIVGAIFGGSNNDEDAAESGNIATVLRPVENPAEGIRQFVFNVAYEEREGRFWYDGEDLDEGFNVRKSGYFNGFNGATFNSNDMTATISTQSRANPSDAWENRASGGTYNCRNISQAEFNEALASLTERTPSYANSTTNAVCQSRDGRLLYFQHGDVN